MHWLCAVQHALGAVRLAGAATGWALCRWQVMRWMEQAAYIAASRVGRGGRHLLLASMDSIAFRHPTRVGDILYVSAQVPSGAPQAQARARLKCCAPAPGRGDAVPTHTLYPSHAQQH